MEFKAPTCYPRLRFPWFRKYGASLLPSALRQWARDTGLASAAQGGASERGREGLVPGPARGRPARAGVWAPTSGCSPRGTFAAAGRRHSALPCCLQPGWESPGARPPPRRPRPTPGSRPGRRLGTVALPSELRGGTESGFLLPSVGGVSTLLGSHPAPLWATEGGAQRRVQQAVGCAEGLEGGPPPHGAPAQRGERLAGPRPGGGHGDRRPHRCTRRHRQPAGREAWDEPWDERMTRQGALPAAASLLLRPPGAQALRWPW